MAYDDGYYYGQCKIVAVVDNTADNGKTVLITTDDNKTYSGTIANKKCEFLLPPRTLYTVQKVSSGSAEFTTKVEAGYGDCILVHLDTGYVEVKQGDIVGLDYIKAATDANLKNKVPEAKAVKELNNRIPENIQLFITKEWTFSGNFTDFKEATCNVSLEGYTPIGVIGFTCGNPGNYIFSCRLSDENTVTVGMGSRDRGAYREYTCIIKVLYLKN